MWRATLPALGLVCLCISSIAQEETKSGAEPEAPVANPGRPTVSTPATLTPVGYLQFESGVLSAWTSPEFSSQANLNEVVKFSPVRRIELLVSTEPFAHSRLSGAARNDAGGVSLGVQGVLHAGEGRSPTISASYFHSLYGGSAPDLDVGSSNNSILLLASGDVRKFHYDGNLFFNETAIGPVRRAQFGQSLSVSHSLTQNFSVSGEIWHFTQPFLRGNAIGNLWAVSYTASKTLVFDAGFDHGLTSTSTQWEAFAGFTYLLPHKIIHR